MPLLSQTWLGSIQSDILFDFTLPCYRIIPHLLGQLVPFILPNEFPAVVFVYDNVWLV